MIATNKLKLVTAVLAVCGLLAGTGVSFVKAADPPAAKAQIGPTLDDKQFLTRTCETLRGSAPTPAEMSYFLADQDAGKRKKVVTWLTEEPTLAATVDVFLSERLNRLTAPPAPDPEAVRRRLSLDLIGTPNALSRTDFIPAKPHTPVQGELLVQAEPTITFLDALYDANVTTTTVDSDEAFLNRVIESARGGQPTRLEKEYFLKDKDAKKREKLLDAFLADPATAKKVGPDWKQAMLNPPQKYSLVLLVDAGTPWADKLIDELMAKKRADDQVLEALTLAATGRLPTDTEKKLVAAVVSKTKDKQAAWREVAGTLAGTDEAKKHADRLKPQANVLFLNNAELDLKFEPAQPPAPPKK